jgi:hypothetical protein
MLDFDSVLLWSIMHMNMIDTERSEHMEAGWPRLVAEVRKESAVLRLEQGGGTAERIALEDAYALAERLLPEIDALLVRHGLMPEDIEGIEVESALPEGYSARRIAETVARTFVFATKFLRSS